uniref:Uncharacterized protein AlNc14C246G9568 n=1 Tax=Albugo laibachii Nc14 TaxID=890382 RepID=F0WT83_9STRA|nr:hypothetical protein PITG_01294 [Albugo laibachii Nc14]|eukprot:CCA24571.1 hypothetical protein PITG_01294 [Albugo laibachii Nc14]
MRVSTRSDDLDSFVRCRLHICLYCDKYGTTKVQNKWQQGINMLARLPLFTTSPWLQQCRKTFTTLPTSAFTGTYAGHFSEIARLPIMLHQFPNQRLQGSLERLASSNENVAMELLNRNARRPKKANHGKRPCSSFQRRLKRLSRRHKCKK